MTIYNYLHLYSLTLSMVNLFRSASLPCWYIQTLTMRPMHWSISIFTCFIYPNKWANSGDRGIHQPTSRHPGNPHLLVVAARPQVLADPPASGRPPFPNSRPLPTGLSVFGSCSTHHTAAWEFARYAWNNPCMVVVGFFDENRSYIRSSTSTADIFRV